eukprot:13526295-Alexandrium_andersonii.AAC.1
MSIQDSPELLSSILGTAERLSLTETDPALDPAAELATEAGATKPGRKPAAETEDASVIAEPIGEGSRPTVLVRMEDPGLSPRPCSLCSRDTAPPWRSSDLPLCGSAGAAVVLGLSNNGTGGLTSDAEDAPCLRGGGSP